MTAVSIRLGVLTVFIFTSLFLTCNQEQTVDESIINKSDLNKMIENFNMHSFYAGATYAAAEFVSAGCKKIALSSPYTEEDLAVML
ncbi:hypothetical protein ACFL6G_09440, partial [candidate division KSB1 bacterium]